MSSQSGNAAFYLIIALPVVLSLAAIGIDLSAYQSKRAGIQTTVDEIAFLAASKLPDADSAKSIIIQELAKKSGIQTQALEVNASSVRLSVKGSYPLNFSGFLSSDLISIAYQASTTVNLSPRDTVLILPDGSSLRPPARQFWGDPREWGASKYFNFVLNPNVDTSANQEPLFWANWSDSWTAYSRWATQHCYNPLLSGIKLSAVALANRLSASETNRLAIIHSPGRVAPELTKTLSFSSVLSNDRYFESQSFTGDDLCRLIAEPEVSSEKRYSLSESSCVSSSNIWGRAHMPKLGSRCPSASAEEVIYYRAARAQVPHASGSHILTALDMAYQQLLSGTETEQARAKRGNLYVEPKREVIVISDILPSSNRALRDQYDSFGISLTLVGVSHEAQESLARQKLEAALESWKGSKLVQTYFAETPEVLRNKVLPYILGSGRQVTLGM